MEKTLVIIKPDAVKRGIVGEVMARFERAGLKIIGMKMVTPDEKHFHEHYEGISKLITRWGKDVYDVTMGHMISGPVVALVLEGVEAVSHVRKMVGALDPQESAPGTIRGDYTHIPRSYTNKRGATLPNIVHASGDKKEANLEISLWFKDDELYKYTLPHGDTVRGARILDHGTKLP